MSTYCYEEADRPRTLADISNTVQCSCCEREAHRTELCTSCGEPFCDECRMHCEEDHTICKACANPMDGGAYHLCLSHRIDTLMRPPEPDELAMAIVGAAIDGDELALRILNHCTVAIRTPTEEAA